MGRLQKKKYWILGTLSLTPGPPPPPDELGTPYFDFHSRLFSVIILSIGSETNFVLYGGVPTDKQTGRHHPVNIYV